MCGESQLSPKLPQRLLSHNLCKKLFYTALTQEGGKHAPPRWLAAPSPILVTSSTVTSDCHVPTSALPFFFSSPDFFISLLPRHPKHKAPTPGLTRMTTDCPLVLPLYVLCLNTFCLLSVNCAVHGDRPINIGGTLCHGILLDRLLGLVDLAWRVQ